MSEACCPVKPVEATTSKRYRRILWIALAVNLAMFVVEVVASFEADYLVHVTDPPLPAWTRLLDAYTAYSAAQGIDLFVGRRTHRLFREAGVTDLRIEPVVHAYLPGHDRRPILHDFIGNVRERLVEGGFIGQAALDDDMAALQRHLDDPSTLVLSHLFLRVWGRIPG